MTASLMQSNLACAEAALAAGCRFFAGYPITPSFEIAEALSRRLPMVEGRFIHDRAGFPTERLDEINPWLKRVKAKIERNLDRILLYRLEGVSGARTLVVAYGATARSARHAVGMARAPRGTEALNLKALDAGIAWADGYGQSGGPGV